MVFRYCLVETLAGGHILFGISMFGRGSALRTALSIVFSVVLLAGIVIRAAGASWLQTGDSTTRELSFSREAGGMTAKLDVHFGAGDKHFSDRPNTILVAGFATTWNGAFATDSALVGTEQRISAEIKGT